MDNNLIFEIEDLNISIDSQTLFKNFSLSLNEGEVVGIFAPTGSGKSTLLNFIADVLQDTKFKYDGKITKKENLKISYVFQEPRLIESVSVLKNVMLPLENQNDFTAAQNIAQNWIEKLNLVSKKDTKANQLSGGEKQRTSLARAFAFDSQLLLLDEPFSAQDEANKNQIIELICNLVQTQKKSALLISHNKEDLQKLCTKIVNAEKFVSDI